MVGPKTLARFVSGILHSSLSETLQGGEEEISETKNIYCSSRKVRPPS